MSYFVETNDELFANQLGVFSSELPSYAALLGLNAAEVKEAQEDAAYMKWVVDALKKVENYAEEVSTFKDIARMGLANVTVLTPPSAPNLDAPPKQVLPDIEARFQQLANRAKAAKDYTPAIGEKLGIVSAGNVFDPKAGKPFLKVSVDAGYPEISFNRGRYPAGNLYRDIGSGYGDKPYATLVTRNYRDENSLPEANESRLIKYKMIYVYKNEEVGFWSDEVSVAVAGK